MPQMSLSLAFWNVENLFDVVTASRPESIRRKVGKDIEGWDDALLGAKLKQLSKVIRSLNGGDGVDILGVCEVENKAVLQKLTAQVVSDGGRKYSIAHADTGDNRGIDVAFLYDASIVSCSHDQMFQHWIVKRYATRELFQVNFTVDGEPLVLVGNHWPSRSAGQYMSEPYRIIAAETLAYWIERIHQKLGKDVGIVVMGDFNDEPFNRAVVEYALSTNERTQVLSGTNHRMLNLMWPLLAEGKGSYHYKGDWNMLDQIMVSRAIVNGKSGWRVSTGPEIEGVDVMSYGRKKAPKRFGIKPGKRDTKGFSDHFPVSVMLERS